MKTNEEVIKRLKNSDKELESFVSKVGHCLDWVKNNPTNNDNLQYSSTKETVRGSLQAAWEGY